MAKEQVNVYKVLFFITLVAFCAVFIYLLVQKDILLAAQSGASNTKGGGDIAPAGDAQPAECSAADCFDDYDDCVGLAESTFYNVCLPWVDQTWDLNGCNGESLAQEQSNCLANGNTEEFCIQQTEDHIATCHSVFAYQFNQCQAARTSALNACENTLWNCLGGCSSVLPK